MPHQKFTHRPFMREVQLETIGNCFETMHMPFQIYIFFSNKLTKNFNIKKICNFWFSDKDMKLKLKYLK